MAILTTIIGNLGADARAVTLGQTPALEFSIASRRSRKDKNGQVVTDWVDITYFKTGIQPYLTKGRTVVVSGEMEVRTYTTQQGEVRVGMKVTANSIEFVGGAQQDTQAAQPAQQAPAPQYQQFVQQPAQPAPPQIPNGELPF